MLAFFRRYQTFFYFIVTFFVIISFSFFGTYSAIPTLQSHDAIVFTAVDGTEITKAEVEDLANFIATDSDDKLVFGGEWGPNFLNDGVIRKDILDTGIANILVAKFGNMVGDELQIRLEKDKRYQPYHHPDAPFLSAENAWAYFAPEINTNLAALKKQSNALSPEAFQARTNLYLAESRFPAPYLRHVISLQNQQYSWLKPDPNFEYTDFFLFGNKNLQDWYGPKFVRLVAEFIINSAIQAEQMGYSVSKTEALADLLRNSTISFHQNQNSPYLRVTNGTEYFNRQLQQMGMDRSKAARIWQKVMLFRRLYHDIGSSAVVDRFAFDQFNNYAKESVEGTIYTLPKELQLADFKALQKFEVYLHAAAKNYKDTLAVPTEFYEVDKLTAKHPELVQKRYVLDIAEVDKKTLQGRVSVKEMWDWQVKDDNWLKLTANFPELGLKNADTAESRHEALESLDAVTKTKLNQYSRSAIVDEHTDWLEDALQKAASVRQEVGLALKNGKTPFAGLKDPKELVALLDSAPIEEAANEDKSLMAAQAKLSRFSADNTQYYRIQVIEKPKKSEVLTFAEANSSGALDSLLDSALKAHYTKIREQSPDKYKDAKGNWKPLPQVREEIALSLFAPTIKNIQAEAKAAGVLNKDEKELSPDRAASLRLLPHVLKIQQKARNGQIETYVRQEESKNSPMPLADQWKLESKPLKENRSSKNPSINLVEALELEPGSWSKVSDPANGAISFYRLVNKSTDVDEAATRTKIDLAHMMLAKEAERQLAQKLIDVISDKGAISLSYLERGGGPEMEPASPTFEGE